MRGPIYWTGYVGKQSRYTDRNEGPNSNKINAGQLLSGTSLSIIRWEGVCEIIVVQNLAYIQWRKRQVLGIGIL